VGLAPPIVIPAKAGIHTLVILSAAKNLISPSFRAQRSGVEESIEKNVIPAKPVLSKVEGAEIQMPSFTGELIFALIPIFALDIGPCMPRCFPLFSPRTCAVGCKFLIMYGAILRTI